MSIYNIPRLSFSGYSHLTLRYLSCNSFTSRQIHKKCSFSSSSSSKTILKKPLDMAFEDTKSAFTSKTTMELCRALFVLKLTTYKVMVENHEKLIALGRNIVGKKLFNFLMRHTFYGHFVGGQDLKMVQTTLQTMLAANVKCILDYSAEEDISEEEVKKGIKSTKVSSQESNETDDLKKYKAYEEFADRRKFRPKARTYFYLSEAQCEKNMEIFLKSIEAVADTGGFTAIKLTALGRPQLLMQLSEVIARTRKYFKEVTGAPGPMLTEGLTLVDLATKLQQHKVKTEDVEVKQWLNDMDYDRKGLMNMFCWSGLVDLSYVMSDMFKVPNLKSGRMERLIGALSSDEEEMFKNMMRRLHHIARVAGEKNVRVMIDAEQSYFQPAISRITMEMMRKNNKQRALIYNTYQCYLKDAYDSMVLDLALANRQGFFFGAKLVRGAYMEQERVRAHEVGYEDPINPSYEATSEMYHKTLSEVLRQIVINRDEESGVKKIAIMVASHNEDTIRFTVDRMQELGILPNERLVSFGQLLGMCDQVSFLLGQSGYSVYKYVPYGPIDKVLPYLSRRAVENHGLLEKVGKELRLLQKEIARRILSGQIFHKPAKFISS